MTPPICCWSAVETVAIERDDGALVIGRGALREALAAVEDYPGLTGSLTCQDESPHAGDCATGEALAIFQLDAVPRSMRAIGRHRSFGWRLWPGRSRRVWLPIQVFTTEYTEGTEGTEEGDPRSALKNRFDPHPGSHKEGGALTAQNQSKSSPHLGGVDTCGRGWEEYFNRLPRVAPTDYDMTGDRIGWHE